MVFVVGKQLRKEYAEAGESVKGEFKHEGREEVGLDETTKQGLL